MLKDYYKILGITPGATLEEIRRAYYNLAMVYHPDKNFDDPGAAVRFSEIKEAYETLTTPKKREKYLQDRWYNQSIGNKRTEVSVTPVSILKLSLELERYVSRLDRHRMNKEGLAHQVAELLSDDTIGRLIEFNEVEMNRQIIATILIVLRPLPRHLLYPLLTKVGRLAGDDKDAAKSIRSFLSSREKAFLWERYKIAAIAIFTLLICLLIFLAGR